MSDACRVCGSGETSFLISVAAQMHPTREKFAFSRCADCGYVFIDPPVDPALLKNYYTEHYYPYRGAPAWGKYAALVEKDDAKLDAKRVASAVRDGGLASGKTILDIGCGRPTFLKACVEKTNCRAIGVDFSSEGWSDGSFDDLTLMTGEIDDLPDDVQPDVVTMWHYLEHDYDPASTLRKLASRAHAATRIIAEVPDYDSQGRRKYGEFWAGWHTPRHVSLFSENNLRMLFERNGWRVVRSERSGTLDPYVLDWMSRMERRGIDWTVNFEKEFYTFVRGMVVYAPRKLLGSGLGLLTIVAEKCDAGIE